MSDLISRTELFNRLARIPIYAVEERTEIYKVINEMETVGERRNDKSGNSSSTEHSSGLSIGTEANQNSAYSEAVQKGSRYSDRSTINHTTTRKQDCTIPNLV